MAPSKNPLPRLWAGDFFFSACCPSLPLDRQTLAQPLLSDCARCRALSARHAPVTTDDYAWLGCCDRR